MSVISTGIGTDNIDIVFNEIDALFNIDFKSRTVKNKLTQLDFIRIGTSGVIRADVPVDSILVSVGAVGTEGLLNFYEYEESDQMRSLDIASDYMKAYYVSADPSLLAHFAKEDVLKGITVTANGFYGPQMRSVRLTPIQNDWLSQIQAMDLGKHQVSNLEMETAGIYAMANLLGHRAISINALLANRKLGLFSKQPEQTETKMIEWALNKIVSY